jgi:hypothetical protein
MYKNLEKENSDFCDFPVKIMMNENIATPEEYLTPGISVIVIQGHLYSKGYLFKIFIMQKLSFFVLVVIVSTACSSKTGSASLPARPASAKAVQDGLKGNKYKAEKAGTHSPFKDDTEIGWIMTGKETDFERKIANEATSLQLHFTNDTTVLVSANNKTYNGTYFADDKQGEDETPGIRLRISYIDEEFAFGNATPESITYTYIVEGINDKSLLLETPRSMNNRKIVVLMNKQ